MANYDDISFLLSLFLSLHEQPAIGVELLDTQVAALPVAQAERLPTARAEQLPTARAERLPTAQVERLPAAHTWMCQGCSTENQMKANRCCTKCEEPILLSALGFDIPLPTKLSKTDFPSLARIIAGIPNLRVLQAFNALLRQSLGMYPGSTRVTLVHGGSVVPSLTSPERRPDCSHFTIETTRGNVFMCGITASDLKLLFDKAKELQQVFCLGANIQQLGAKAGHTIMLVFYPTGEVYVLDPNGYTQTERDNQKGIERTIQTYLDCCKLGLSVMPQAYWVVPTTMNAEIGYAGLSLDGRTEVQAGFCQGLSLIMAFAINVLRLPVPEIVRMFNIDPVVRVSVLHRLYGSLVAYLEL
jgi:hypothetical protein